MVKDVLDNFKYKNRYRLEKFKDSFAILMIKKWVQGEF